MGYRCYINRIENKVALPSMQAFFYICEYLQITPKEFFDEEDTNPTKINSILEGLKNLDIIQLDIVLDVIYGLQHKKVTDK